MPVLANTLALIYIQNMASITWRSQGPACGIPYWQMVMKMVAMDTTTAGMKSDSNWSVKELVRLPGR